MKLNRILLLLSLSGLLVLPVQAQDADADEEKKEDPPQPKELAFEEGDHIAALGISFLNYGYYNFVYDRSTIIPPLQFSYEVGIHEDVSVGGFFGIGHWQYDDYYAFNDTWTHTATQFGAVGSFHYLRFLNEEFDVGVDATKLDFYVNLYVGFEIRSTSINLGDYNEGADTDGSVLFNPNLGFRYLLSDNVGVFFETGYGTYGVGQIGVSGHF